MCHIRLPDALAALLRESTIQDSTESPALTEVTTEVEARIAELVRKPVS
jgi:hypothetical protein